MWGAGFATGIGVGFAIGLIVGSLTVKQKSWSELTDKEKKARIWLIAAGVILLVAGILTFLFVR
ncbi:hypothetical protein ACFLUK_00090 [Chloroflexota bacterium]|jgi:membrane protein YqaA with SNARE-associated domain